MSRTGSAPREMAARPDRGGGVRFTGFGSDGRPQFAFEGDVAPRWFRYSNADFRVDVTGVETRLMLRERVVEPGRVFRQGDL